MNKKLLYSLLFSTSVSAMAQGVPKAIVVEHFTNTYCSVCASRNPGFTKNLESQPEVIHLSFHPSSPYSACTLNKYDKNGNDNRTKYYNIYGSTPRLVIQGKALSTSANYADSAIFANHKNKTTAFQMRTTLTDNTDSFFLRMVVIKRDTSSLSTADLLGVLVEDTLNFNAPNGEKQHHDVYRQAFWNSGTTITLPANVGDSVVLKSAVAKDKSGWNLSQAYAIAIIQKKASDIIQASKSKRLSGQTMLNIQHSSNENIRLYPNPVQDIIYLETQEPIGMVQIYSTSGMVVFETLTDWEVDVRELPTGTYFLQYSNGEKTFRQPFIKQ